MRRKTGTTIVKRSIVLAGHKTSVSLEDAFWKGLKEIVGTRKLTVVVGEIDADRKNGNLSSAIRLFVLDHYRNQVPGSAANAAARGAAIRDAAAAGASV